MQGRHLFYAALGCLLSILEAYCLDPIALKSKISIDQPIAGFAVQDAFGGLRFDQPVGIVAARGETNRLFVVEKPGRIAVITNLAAPTRTVFLDVTQSTWSHNEGGLLGLAFHPGFATNGQFFIYRTAENSGLYDQLSRFTVSAKDPNAADPNSELVILAQADLSDAHNAGGLQFGPDGYLYLSVGDELPLPEDTPDHDQAVDKGIFGSIIRIDVDKRPGNLRPNPHLGFSDNYLVPADNPWVGATSFMGYSVDPATVRTELYAIGFRNPWRLAIDEVSGKIMVGDVGAGVAEEIDDVVKGGNYGFPFREGYYQADAIAPADLKLNDPVFAYDHIKGIRGGSVVIGGLICRNVSIQGLEGLYVFGDGRTGNIWTMDPSHFGQAGAPPPDWITADAGIVSFGRDPRSGDVLMANYNTCTLRKLVYVSPDEQRIPQKLSDSGLFSGLSTLTPADGLMPYTINASFWSDNALKRRWFGLTDPSRKIGFAEEGNWSFPTGTIWIKHFDLEMVKGNPATARRVETRVLVKNDTGIHGFTYRWNDAQTDATLAQASGEEETFAITDGGQVRTQVWQFPARAYCNRCHTAVAGYSLGFNTPQLNLTNLAAGSLNQLDLIARAGYLDRAPGDSTHLRKLADPRDPTQPLEYRVKSFMSANCSQCHQPGGEFGATWDARLTTPMAEQNVIGAIPGGPLSPDSRIIGPGSVTNSMMYFRLSNLEDHVRMPPLASTILDDRTVEMMADWITNMPKAGWFTADISPGPLRGSLVQRTNLLAASGAGVGESFAFSHRVLSNNFEIVAHLKGLPTANPGMWAGLMIRGTTNVDDSFASVTFGQTGTNTFTGYYKNVDQTVVSSSDPLAAWLRLVREGNTFSAWESRSGSSWKKIGSAAVSLPNLVLGGLAVASGNPLRYATAEFDSYETTSIQLLPPRYDTNSTVPLEVTLDVAVSNYGGAVKQVNYYAEDQLIGSKTAAPWRLDWTNAMAGAHLLRATALDSRGYTVSSDPVTIVLKGAPSSAIYRSEVALTNSQWAGIYGQTGFILPLYRTNLLAGSLFAVDNAGAGKWLGTWPALDNLAGGLLASAWYSFDEFAITFKPPFENPYAFTILLTDYFKQGGKAQLTLCSAMDGGVLSQRVEEAFGAGRYVTWIARGPIVLKVQSLTAGAAYVGGVFIDPAQPAIIALTEPLAEATYTLPTNINLRAQITAKDIPVHAVAYYDGSALIGKITAAPFDLQWSGALAGDHTLAAVAIGPYGPQTTSAPVTIHCALPLATATFVGTDSTIQGNWMSHFGSDAYAMALGPMRQGPTAHIAMGAEATTWAPDYSGENPLGLRLFGTNYLLSAYWISTTTIGFNVDLLDGVQHVIALYIVHYSGGTIPETIRVEDAGTGRELDEQFASDVSQGVYFIWNARGSLQFTITRRDPWTLPALSGIFVGEAIPRAYQWWGSYFGDPYATSPDWYGDPDKDGRSNLMEYAMGSDPRSPDGPIPLSVGYDGQYVFVDAGFHPLPTDIQLSLEQSSDLVNWQASSVAPSLTADDSFRFAIPREGSGPRFFRLRVDLTSTGDQ